MVAVFAKYSLILSQYDKGISTKDFFELKKHNSNFNIYPCCYTQIISLLWCCIDAFIMHWNVLNLETEITLTITDK